MSVNATSAGSFAFDYVSQYAQQYILPHLAPLSPYNPQPYFEYYYRQMYDNYTEFQIATYGSLCVQVLFYFGSAIPGFLYQFLGFMQRFKVQPGKQHTLAEQWICLKRVAVSKTTIYLPLIMLLFVVIRQLGLQVPIDYDSMPHWYEMIPKMLFCLLCEDTWHYWAHRAFHIPSLYGPIHKLHHQFNVPFGMAAEYAHPLETIGLGVGFFIPLPFVCNHLFVFWCWLAVRMVQTIDAHQGFYFPWFNPLYLLPFYGGVRFHDFHHEKFTVNYASTFTFWDWICGTDGEYWKLEEERIKAGSWAHIRKPVKGANKKTE